jgi:hypothetical protein
MLMVQRIIKQINLAFIQSHICWLLVYWIYGSIFLTSRDFKKYGFIVTNTHYDWVPCRSDICNFLIYWMDK